MSDQKDKNDPAPVSQMMTTSGFITASGTGYTLWEFDGNNWNIKQDRSIKGFVPSAPPKIPGRFRGQLRAILSVPANSRRPK